MHSPSHQSKQHRFPKTASWDIVIVSVVAVTSMIIAIAFNLHERFERWMLQFPIWRQWRLDEGMICFVILSLALAIFSLRRWRELLGEITKRKETEESLRREEGLYQTLVETAPDAIFLIDRNDRILFANSHAIKLLGRPRADVIGEERSTFFPKEIAERQFEALQRVFKSGMPQQRINKLILPNQTVWHDTMLSPIKNEQNEVIAVLGISRDITELKQAEESVRVNEAKYRNLVSTINEGLIQVSNDDVIQFVNQRLCNMFGYTQEELIGKKAYELFAEDEAKKIIREKNILRTAGVSDQYELQLKKKNGKNMWALISGAPLCNTTGEVTGSVALLTDITDRKRAENELQQSQEKLRNIFEHSTNLFYSHTPDHLLTYVSPQTRQFFDCEPEEALVQWTNFVTDNPVNAKGYEYTQRAIETGQPQPPYELELIGKKGRIVWVEVHEAPVVVNGTTVAIVGSLTDITQRKKAEQELQSYSRILEATAVSAEQLLKSRQMESSINHVLTNLGERARVSRTYIFENSTSAEGTLLTSQRYEWVAEGITPQLENPDLQNFPLVAYGFSRWVETLGKGQPILGHIRDFPQREREVLSPQNILSILVMPIFVGAKWWGFIGFDSCIHEREWTPVEISALRTTANTIGAALQRIEAEGELVKLRKAVDASPEIIFMTDKEGIFTYVNPEFTKIYGYTAFEVIGKATPRILKSGQLSKEFYTSLWGKLLAKERFTGEVINKTKEGRLVILEISINPVANEEGDILGFLAIQSDVTERRKFEQQLMRTQRLESIGTLASGVAHDLNNILSPILLAVELLKRKLPDEQGKKLVSNLESSALRGKDIIKQILTFARGFEGERGPLQVKHLLREMEHIVRETFPKSIEFVHDIPSDLWTISGDATQLHQVLMNLCVNARDAMPHGGTLTLTAENTVLHEQYVRVKPGAVVGPYIKITVADTGCGISKQNLERIFEPFFTTKEPGKGTGLGLSTVHSIVKSHGGFIDVSSVVGKGTTFIVMLPAVSTTQDGETEEQTIKLPQGKGEYILIVDDEESVRQITAQTLTMHNYGVLLAGNGIEAIAQYTEHRDTIALVLTDLMMPEMDGASTIRALKHINPKLDIIAASGVGSDIVFDESLKREVQAFLQKPYTAETLLTTLHNVLAHQQSQAQQ